MNVINFADDLKFPYVLYSNVNTSGTLEFSFAHSLHGGSEMRLDFGEFHDRPMPKAHYTHRAHRENEKMRERERVGEMEHFKSNTRIAIYNTF